jgi:hypothetical protein
MTCRRCGEEYPPERGHPIERCITVLRVRVRVYDAQLEAVLLKSELLELRRRLNLG